MKLRSLISLVAGVSTCAAVVVADNSCFVAVPYTDPCALNGVTLSGHPPCTNCTDFIIWTDPVNNIFSAPTGFQAFHAVTADCMVQRRRCIQTLPAGTWLCVANGVYTYSSNSLDTDPDYPCDGGGEH
ncbi:MAG: hypothetical protein IT434_16285 [Phycisphaerales bacterium]|jgi:hypothetical protein|nr:hypothetical protein [Phycisphaerales bacterium]